MNQFQKKVRKLAGNFFYCYHKENRRRDQIHTMKQNLTEGNILKSLLSFSLPYLLSCFLQTFYGMADLFIIGQFRGAASTTAVSIGSQIMHMITVIIMGLAMGSTIKIGHAVGAKDDKTISKTIGNTICIFLLIALLLTILLLCNTFRIISLMHTPIESVTETYSYLIICFAGIPFIISYNIISSIFRGLGDSRRPMYFVAVACIINILLDFLLIGGLGIGAAGAALGTVLSQAACSIFALLVIIRKKLIILKKPHFIPDKQIFAGIMKSGFPIALQDGFIQVSFLIITVIANKRGLIAATGVGIVEKIIGFLFLVPSAMLSSVSAITAQNIGAKNPKRAQQTLLYALSITIVFGLFCTIYCQFLPQTLVGLFSKEAAVVEAGCDYLQSYVTDCIFAGIHFCFSGYFCGYGKSSISFIHNLISILLVRIPGAYFASILFPESLFPMGMAAPLGSILSAVICIGFFIYFRKNERHLS